MLVVLGVALGLVLGVWMAAVWGLRRSRRGTAVLLLVVLALVPVAYFWGAEAFGWPTPGSAARSEGLVSAPGHGGLLAGTVAVIAAAVLAALVRAGVTRRLEEWSTGSDRR